MAISNRHHLTIIYITMPNSLSVSTVTVKAALAILVFVVCILTGCSDNPAAYDSQDIAIKTTEEGLEVLNKLNRPVYYASFDQEFAAVINWAPFSTQENELKPERVTKIPFTNIGGFKKGGNIIFNYWTSKNPEAEVDVRNIVISTEK